MFKNAVLVFSLLILGACGLAATRPKLEMSMAQTAFMAAKEAKADEAAPNVFRKAEIYYIKARSAYRRKYFNKAQNYALLCKKFSEEAEFEAIKKQTLEGNAP